jgi:ubiquinone biosynthesis protein
MSEQLGLRGLTRRLGKEASSWAVMLPQFPRLLHHALSEARTHELEQKMGELVLEQKRQNRLLSVLLVLLATAMLWYVWQ